MRCGNPKCSSSTGIHEGLTFGSGRLDSNGYWEFPCRLCAIHHDENIQATIADVRESCIAKGLTSDEAQQYIYNAEWLQLKAWPLASTDIAAETAEIQAQFEKDKEFYFEEDYDLINEG